MGAGGKTGRMLVSLLPPYFMSEGADDSQNTVPSAADGALTEHPEEAAVSMTPLQEAIAASGLTREALLRLLLDATPKPEKTEAIVSSAIEGILADLMAMADAPMVTVEQVSSYTPLCLSFGGHMNTVRNLWKTPTVQQSQQLKAWQARYDALCKRIHGKPVDRSGPDGVHVQGVM